VRGETNYGKLRGRGHQGGLKKVQMLLTNRESLLLTKPSIAPNKILQGHAPISTTDNHQLRTTGSNIYKTTNLGGTTDGRARLPREFLDDGQGKSDADTSDMEISTTTSEGDVHPRADGSVSPSDQATGCNKLLLPPIIAATGEMATGATTEALRKQNKHQRTADLLSQHLHPQWTMHRGHTVLQENHWAAVRKTADDVQMAPQGLALHHEAAGILAEWEQMGCPTCTGRDWTTAEIQAAIDRGPHQSALEPEALHHFADEVRDKVAKGQARVVLWEEIKGNHPRQLKVSPVAAIPHKSRAYRSILDLSFSLRLREGGTLPSVNDTTTKLAPRGAIDQLGHSLKRIIHAFAEAEDDAVILLAKWDIQDGFWRLNCRKGEEWNFSYVLPQPEGEPTRLVVPTSLQMGWVESPPYFCAASETARDVAVKYIETPTGSLPPHKLEHWATANTKDVSPSTGGTALRYVIEVYVDDFIAAIIPTTPGDIEHVARGVLHGIHDVFPACDDGERDPVSAKKLKKGDGTFATRKCILGFDFDGSNKTIWLEEEKRDALLAILHKWIRGARLAHQGIPFVEFESVVSKLRHAFTALPEARGLLSPCNWILRVRPPIVYFHRNGPLLEAITDIRTILRETINSPTLCRDLVASWPDYIGIVDASSHGVGGVVLGELSGLPPTVFRVQWPRDVTDALVSVQNPRGLLSISDLEMAGILLLWLCLEGITKNIAHKHIAFFSDNSPTVSWVDRLASRKSRVAARLVRALALRLNLHRACPLTPVHIPGVENALADIPSRSFGSNPDWFCQDDTALLTLFSRIFPLPNQASWTAFRFTTNMITRLTSVLRMKDFTLAEWRRLPKIGQHIGETGQDIAGLWEWTLTYRGLSTRNGCVPSQDLLPASVGGPMAEGSEFRLARSLALSRPLDRRSRWPVERTQQK